MKKILSVLKRRKYLFLAIILLVVVFIFIGKKQNKTEAYTVSRQNISESILLSGDVRARDKADLGFAASGRIGRIYVSNNQKVTKGALLAQLEIGELFADLKIKEINSKTSDLELESAKEELERVTSQENTKVENALRELLSDDLLPIASSASYILSAPNITGTYESNIEGTYKIRIVDDAGTTVVRTFDLENTEREINEGDFTLLGTRGLFISFDTSNIEAYEGTTWYLDIPNKNSASYVVNLNAYNEAKKTRDRNIGVAKSEYDRVLSEGGEVDSVAQAEIDKIRAEIRKHSIYAPFTGTVTNIEKNIGENVSVGERVITVLGDGGLEVVLLVPELDIPKLSTGAIVAVVFDAIPGERFEGVIESINSRETEVDGVPIYEAFVELSPDARIRSGMSTKGEIVLSGVENALAVPTYLITKEDNQSFVSVLLPDGKKEKREITLGITGSDSMVEVLTGLTDGEQILGE